MLKEYLDIFIIAYLDNILIFSETLKEYTEYIYKVLEVYIKYNLRLKLKKYKFRVIRIEFLRYIIILEKIEIDLKKIKSIFIWLKSINIKKLQQFLRLANYY